MTKSVRPRPLQSPHLLIIAATALALLPFATRAQAQTRVDVTRDTWISEMGAEREGNNGGASKLKTKGCEEMSIVDIDPKPLAGHIISSATLHLHSTSPDAIALRVTVSSLSTDWVEGASESYKKEDGAASFNAPQTDHKPWAFPGSDFTAAALGLGNSLWRFADATPPDHDRWQTVAVDPRIIAARIAGISFGFVVYDDVGNEYERNGEKFVWKQFPNRFFDSKDSNKSHAPYFTITLGAEDKEAPDAPANVSSDAAGLPAGESMVNWTTPADHGPAGTIGFIVRYADGPAPAPFDWDHATPLPQYLVPLAGKPGQKVSMHLRDLGLKSGAPVTLAIKAVDAAGNLSPAITASVLTAAPAPVTLNPSTIKPFEDAGQNPAIGGVEVSILDSLDKVQPITGAMIPAEPQGYQQANHLWSAAQKKIRLYGAKNEFVSFQILLTGKTDGLKAELDFDGGVKSDLYAFRYINTAAGPMPDPLLPLSGPIQIPTPDKAIPDQKNAALIADVFIPHELAAGPHHGTLKLSHGSDSLAIPIELNVWDFTLPDQLSFIVEMNCYNLPDNNLPYYRMAQAHRTDLNRLGYNWHGEPAKNCIPSGQPGQFDWTKYDAHYGPIFDGSAFNDLPRKGVPVDAHYLPICENWPVSVDAFKGGYWADQAFDAKYWNTFSEACADFAKHASSKNWNDTLFEFFLNGKVYYKVDKGAKTDGHWNNCSSPWCFDEPVNTQDFWALREYGMAFHRGVDPVRGNAKMVFRCDISRSEWQRDLLDGILDVDVVGGSFRPYLRSIMNRRAADHEITINYGGANPLPSSNAANVAWALDVWTLGADGITPWQTIGTAKSWKEADQLSVFYPPPPGDASAPKGEPVASVRLKAFRRAQQDVEYLTILTEAGHYPRFAVADAARTALDIHAKLIKTSESDAGRVSFNNLTPQALWTLRMRVGAALDAMKPPAKRQWIDLRPPTRNVDQLPPMGYVEAPAAPQ